jgi:TonB family protein
LHLLLSDIYEEDAVESYRRREAVWISVAFHGAILLLLIFSPKWIPKSVYIVPVQQKQDSTFLELPPDQLKVKPPKTDKISDQNRIAQSKTPVPSREALRKLIDPRAPGRPAPAPAPAPAPQQAQVTPEQQPAPQQGTAQMPAQQQPQPQQTAKLESPVPPPQKKNPFTIASPGSSISKAIESVANSHGTNSVSFGGGEYGSGIQAKADKRGDLEILSDTLGVDFGPYMRRLRQTVQEHWDPLIPQSAMPPEMKKGTVVIEFAILKDGRVANLHVVKSSGDPALDRAAYGAITYAIPLPNLPQQFAGDYLLLRAHFLYNPDKNAFE